MKLPNMAASGVAPGATSGGKNLFQRDLSRDFPDDRGAGRGAKAAESGGRFADGAGRGRNQEADFPKNRSFSL